MKTLKINMPETLFAQLSEYADSDNATIEQVALLAIAEKIHFFNSMEILNERAKRADFDMFVKMLEKVPDVEPMEFDRL
ncbi:MAG: toxin-antitoxin system HicB family antitoxin [Ignavibacteria bacterium]|nr:toxin-antitoxin system HicB family antitoxin [Ignavibacteria bacterium]